METWSAAMSAACTHTCMAYLDNGTMSVGRLSLNTLRCSQPLVATAGGPWCEMESRNPLVTSGYCNTPYHVHTLSTSDKGGWSCTSVLRDASVRCTSASGHRLRCAMRPCDCTSADTACRSGQVDVATLCGCHRLPGKLPFCYVLDPSACATAYASSTPAFLGAAWRDCEAYPPNAPPSPIQPPAPPLLPWSCCPMVDVVGAEDIQWARSGRFHVVEGIVGHEQPVFVNSYSQYLFWWPACKTWQIGPHWRYDHHSLACGACNQHNQRPAHCPTDYDGWVAWNSTGRTWLQNTVKVTCANQGPSMISPLPLPSPAVPKSLAPTSPSQPPPSPSSPQPPPRSPPQSPPHRPPPPARSPLHPLRQPSSTVFEFPSPPPPPPVVRPPEPQPASPPPRPNPQPSPEFHIDPPPALPLSPPGDATAALFRTPEGDGVNDLWFGPSAGAAVLLVAAVGGALMFWSQWRRRGRGRQHQPRNLMRPSRGCYVQAVEVTHE